MKTEECVKRGASVLDAFYPKWVIDFYDEFRELDDAELLDRVSLFFFDIVNGNYLDEERERRFGIRPERKITPEEIEEPLTLEHFKRAHVLGWTDEEIAHYGKLWRAEISSRFSNTVHSA